LKPVVVRVSVDSADGKAGADKGFHGATQLNVTATSRTDIILNPGQLTFPIVLAGRRSAPQVLNLECVGKHNWRLTELDTNGALVDASYKETFRLAGRIGYQLLVSLKTNIPPGPFRYQIFLKTNDQTMPHLPILIEGTVQEELSVVPKALNLGSVKVGQ